MNYAVVYKGCLAGYLCSMLCPKKRLFVFGCHGDKHTEVEKNLKRIGASSIFSIVSSFEVHFIFVCRFVYCIN